MIWILIDIFTEKVARYLDSLDQDEEGRFSSRQEKRARRTFCLTLHQINRYAETVGKDGKFQLLVCLGVRWVNDIIPANPSE